MLTKKKGKHVKGKSSSLSSSFFILFLYPVIVNGHYFKTDILTVPNTLMIFEYFVV